MQKADLFIQIKTQFESVRSQYRKLTGKWELAEKSGDRETADLIWEDMERLKIKMLELKSKAEKLQVRR